MYSLHSYEPIHWSMSPSNCCFLTCIQVSQEAGRVVWYSHLFKYFPQFVVIHIIKWFRSQWSRSGFFLELSCFFYDPPDIGNLVSGSSAFSKCRVYISKFSDQVLLKLRLKDFEHYLASMWNEYNCAVVWIFFGIAFLGDWNKNWLFPQLSFPNLLAYWVQHLHSIIFFFFFF